MVERSISDEIAEAFERVLEANCPPSLVRAIESGERPPHSLWEAIEESGFLDAMIPEKNGGVGLSLADAASIAMLAGRFAVPLPVAETMAIRGLYGAQADCLPSAPLTFAGNVRTEGGVWFAHALPSGRHAEFALAEIEGRAVLLSLDERRIAPVQPLALECDARWTAEDVAQATELPLPARVSLAGVQALVHALELAGAIDAALQRTLNYAGERAQFGKPIAKFQAIQHQLAVMAEHAFAARMAALLASQGGFADHARIAIAKARCAMAATHVAGLAHSIHGAIGFTDEYDLQLLTRRLHFWRQAAGSEQAWQEALGCLLLTEGTSALDMIRAASEAPAESGFPITGVKEL